MNNLTLVIPAKNESESLPVVLDELKKYNLKIKIILKEDDVATIESIKNKNVEIIFQENQGYGDALIKGINSVSTEYFCIFNADGSFNPKELIPMMNLISKEKSDFVFASRYEKKAGSEDDTFLTYIGNKIFSLIGNIFFQLNISDILYTFVLGKTNETKKLELKSNDFRFCVELPIKAKRNNLKLISFGSYERKRIAGKKKVNEFKDGLLILFAMVKLFFKH